jgi:hypothetical protein
MYLTCSEYSGICLFSNKEKIAGCSESHTKHINIFCPRDLEILNIKIRNNMKTNIH